MMSGVRLADQGHFWIGVTYEQRDGQSLVDGSQLYVEYQIPEVQTQPHPVVLIHGGGGQALDWMTTPDGRPGWRTLLLQRGYAVYLVDRPGHGRSPRHLAEKDEPAGPGPLPTAEALGEMFAGRSDTLHTQWPGTGEPNDPALAQLLASQRQTPFDLGKDHEWMRQRGAELLDRIGPAIVITSSAGGPSGWLMADARPRLVRAIVALEPLGPSGPLPLSWGLSAARITYDPPVASPNELVLVNKPAERDRPALTLQGEPARRLPQLAEVPIAIVSGERSFASAMDIGTVEYLRQAGCIRVDHVVLAERGIHGNGHLMMIERNNGAVLDAVTDWLGKQLRSHNDSHLAGASRQLGPAAG